MMNTVLTWMVFGCLAFGTALQGEVLSDKKELKLGVLCAHPKELGTLASEMEGATHSKFVGMREYICGNLWGKETVLATSRVGKVAAASTVTYLINCEHVDAIIFLGIAGGIDTALSQSDIVIAESLVQHDMDSRPLISQFTVPLINVAKFQADPKLVTLATESAQDFLEKGGQHHVCTGLVATGDRFINDSADRNALRQALPGLLAVDMEGAAVAQVCYEHDVPFVVVRTISNSCDAEAPIDCMQFLYEIAPTYTKEVLRGLYQRL